MLDINKINLKINDFYQNRCEPKQRAGESNAKFAVRISYQTATKRAVVFKDKKDYAKIIRTEIEPILIDFLNNQNYSTNKIIELMKEIRKKYRNVNIDSWTFGNSQKWINIAIKYYLILELHDKNYTIEELNNIIENYQYVLFPVDRIMIEHIEKDFDISFYDSSNNLSWSNCDDLIAFTDYWDSIKGQVEKQMGTYPIIYEIQSW